MRYSDDIIEEVRSKNDIVDVVSQYVRLTKKGKFLFWFCALFITKKTPSFSVRPANRCITALAAEQEGMYLILLWSMRIILLERP